MNKSQTELFEEYLEQVKDKHLKALLQEAFDAGWDACTDAYYQDLLQQYYEPPHSESDV